MAVLDILKKVNDKKLKFKNHPCLGFDMETKIHYLNGLILVANEDDNICKKEKEYLSLLINSLDLNSDLLEDIVEFSQNPEEELVAEIFEVIAENEIKYIFLIDSLMLAYHNASYAESEKNLILQYCNILDIDEDKFNILDATAVAILEKDSKKLINLLNDKMIEQEIINHYIEFFNIELSQTLNLDTKFKKIGIGSDFGVLLTKKGTVKSFGMNYFGELGLGHDDSVNKDELQDVIDLPKKVKCISISVGKNHTLALLENNDIYAWGENYYGQLGDDTKETRLSPFKVIGLPSNLKPVKIIASVDSSLVLYSNGDIYVCGYIASNSSVFIPYKLDFKVIDIDIMYSSSNFGADNSLVILDENNKLVVHDFSENNILKWCKFDNAIFKPTGLPIDIKIKQFVAGDSYIHVLLENNQLYSIGTNEDGQLGLGEFSEFKRSFSRVYGVNQEILTLATVHNTSSFYTNNENGCNFSLALTKTNLYGCGTNKKYQLGNQDKYYETSWEDGIIFKETKYTKCYAESKFKVIDELSKYIQEDSKLEICCGNDSSYLYDYTNSKLYILGSSLFNKANAKIFLNI